MTLEPPPDARWIVARFGAYMHYAVPRILQRAGALEQLYTDFYAGDAGTFLFRRMPAKWRGSLLNRMLGRFSCEIPQSKITSFPLLGIRYYLSQHRAPDVESRSAAYLQGGDEFARRVVRRGFGTASAVYTFNTAALPILQAARERGIFTAYEQTIAPRAYEEELLAEEQRRFPGWAPERVQGPSTQATIDLERREWELADVILCGSEFVKEGVRHCGGPVERCVVVPYGVEDFATGARRPAHGGPLRVLTVGEAGLRKGVTYLHETAKLLQGEAEFRWIGSVSLLPEAREKVGATVDLRGVVPHNQINEHFEWADVFCLPSVCEGSATVIYEALMSGLPVITTPNAGSLVRDGVDGFIVPIRSPEALRDAFLGLHGDRSRLEAMSQAALESAERVSLDAYERRLGLALGFKRPVESPS
jgi:hypothetical protein